MKGSLKGLRGFVLDYFLKLQWPVMVLQGQVSKKVFGPTPSNFKESQFSVAALAYLERTRSPCRTIYSFHLRPHLPIEHYFHISCRRGGKKNNYFTSCDPHHDIYTFSYWQIFWHSI